MHPPQPGYYTQQPAAPGFRCRDYLFDDPCANVCVGFIAGIVVKFLLRKAGW
jgi:hypothetical protein